MDDSGESIVGRVGTVALALKQRVVHRHMTL